MNTAKPFRVDGAGGVDKGEGQPGFTVVPVEPGDLVLDLNIAASRF